MARKYWSVYLDDRLIERAKEAAKIEAVSLNEFFVRGIQFRTDLILSEDSLLDAIKKVSEDQLPTL